VTETLTIRLDRRQRQALRARAMAEGRTESDIVRELLDRQLNAAGSVGTRAARHIGRLDFDTATAERDPWRAHLRRANVRP
jgi:hypothetical protein